MRYRLGDGKVSIDVIGEEEFLFSEHHACPLCGFSIDDLEPRMFRLTVLLGLVRIVMDLGSKHEVDVRFGHTRLRIFFT